MVDPLERIWQRLDGMDNDHILTTWNALSDYDPSEYYDQEGGVAMDTWTEAVYSTKGIRGI